MNGSRNNSWKNYVYEVIERTQKTRIEYIDTWEYGLHIRKIKSVEYLRLEVTEQNCVAEDNVAVGKNLLCNITRIQI